MEVEPWLRGTLKEVDPVARGVLHAFELAAEDVTKWCGGLSEEELEARPYGVAPVGFHLRHIAGSLDRLLSYAEGLQLTGEQVGVMKAEMESVSRDRTMLIFAEGLETAVERVRRLTRLVMGMCGGWGRRCC